MSVTVADVRDLVQIAFFVVIATITVLTYFHARRTILQPLRTEVFKQQLKLMSDVLDFLTREYVGAVNTAFPLTNLLDVNTLQMFDDYAESQLGLEVNREERPYSTKNCPHYLLPQHLLVEAGPYRTQSSADGDARRPAWSEYKYEAIAIPNDFTEAQEKLRAFARSPLAPKRLIELLLELDAELHRRITLVGEVLTECAREMPATYPDATKMETATFSWVTNRFNRRSERLEPTIDRIVEYARTYFAPERLLT